MTATELEQTRQAIIAVSAKSTSSRNARLTRKHVALSVLDQSLRDQLMACTSRKPCNQPACPQCAERRGNRYYNQTLKPAIAKIPNPYHLYWITVNVNRNNDLEAGSKVFTKTEHAALKYIVEQINTKNELFQIDRLRIWATREVEPELQPDGSFQWLFHWHIIAHADGSNIALVKALKARWHEPRAVHVKRIDSSKPKAFTKSLQALAGYGIKSRYTVNTATDTATDRRDWLPQTAINDLATFKQQRNRQWLHFKLGTSS